ncbi:hybrid sensor histidine kinase/response regulator [Undibacterium sp. Tian12W]|uniref:hybrid sensor histidine kinase/response regulator n=1 Tax=Undibacterium sp. Tian12W TaxID=3413054 RepID=UPI003BF1C949
MEKAAVESRILIFAPIGKDARLIDQLLQRAKLETFICRSDLDVQKELRLGAAVLIITDEALSAYLLKFLNQFLTSQPAWSDIPILILTKTGIESPNTSNFFQLGNITLLERPLQGVTLISAVMSAFRGRQRQYAMREVDRRKDEFLAMLAHELRNPLAPISAASDLLNFPNLTPERIKRTSEVISRQVKHMTGLIDDLLDVSRVSRGLVTLKEEVLDARHVATNAIEQVRPLLDARRHHLTLQTTSVPVYIKGDPKRLIQILSNVLNNAAKYTLEGGEITLSMDSDADSIVFTIRDNGIGIEPNTINCIFDMFAQAERSSDRTQGGLGIGLALVQNLVQLHGGTVTANSDGLGLGSKFTITLPRFYPVSMIDNESAVKREPATGNINVLVVDDNEDAASMLGMYLELAGCSVKIVHSGNAALNVAKTVSLDVCLLDIGLPDMDGTQLAKNLRRLPTMSDTMLVAITGYGQDIDRQRSSEAGFDHHMVKPVDMDALMRLLAQLG